MQIPLTPEEIRVLGSLMEKALATPDYYPLSLNALTNACNQKSNRDPVVSYDEEQVEGVATGLIQKGLVQKDSVGRVPKYEETLTRDNSLVPREAAVLCVLLLRGPQTPGAIRSRTARLCTFEDLGALHGVLENLAGYGFTEQLPRLPGHKESRYTHLFSAPEEEGEVPIVKQAPPSETAASSPDSRVEALEKTVEDLRNELLELKTAFQAFKDQF